MSLELFAFQTVIVFAFGGKNSFLRKQDEVFLFGQSSTPKSLRNSLKKVNYQMGRTEKWQKCFTYSLNGPLCECVSMYFSVNTVRHIWCQFHQCFTPKFVYESALRSFSLVILGLCNFLAQ